MRARIFKDVLLVVAVMALCACTRHGGDDTLLRTDTFTLTGDSIAQGNVFAFAKTRDRIETNVTMAWLDSLYGNATDTGRVRFAYGRPWRAHDNPSSRLPQYHSDQMMIDALMNLYTDLINEGAPPAGTIRKAYSDNTIYLSICLSLAHLVPQQAMNWLRSKVDRDTIIMQQEGTWPVVCDHLGWAVAAWEVYLATGSRQWLAFSHAAISKTLALDHDVLLDQPSGLFTGSGFIPTPGVLSHADHADQNNPAHNSILRSQISKDSSPTQNSQKNLTQSNLAIKAEQNNHTQSYETSLSRIPLGNNILAMRAYQILSRIDEELGLDPEEHAATANRIKDAINQNLWNERSGYYSSFLYANAFRTQAPTADNSSQALAVLWDIADDERAEHLIARTPTGDCGINASFPPTNTIEPYFCSPAWSLTQALWTIAAAYDGNSNATLRSAAALWRAHALFLSRGISIRGKYIDRLVAGSAGAAVILRAILGIQFTTDGIEFHPTVPPTLTGDKTLTGLRYRDCTLDITIKGVGNDIEEITLDGQPIDGNFIPINKLGVRSEELGVDPSQKNNSSLLTPNSSLKRIVIRLRQAWHGSQHITLHHNQVLLPPTPQVLWTDDSAAILNYNPNSLYRLFINGTRGYTITDSAFAIPKTPLRFAEYTLAQVNKYGYGYSSQPTWRYDQKQKITIPLAQNSQNSQKNLSTLNSQLSKLNNNLTLNSQNLTLKINAPVGGDYLISIKYLPTGTCDVRQVYAGTHLMGTLILHGKNLTQTNADSPQKNSKDGIFKNPRPEDKTPGADLLNPRDLREVNQTIKLLKGENVITLRQVRLPKKFTPCQPIEINIIKK